MDAHGPGLERRDPPHLVRERGISGRAEGHLEGELGGSPELDAGGDVEGAPEPEPGAALQIGADQERHPGPRLQAIELDRNLGGRSGGHDHAADRLLLHQGAQPLLSGAALGREVAQHPGHHHLPGLLPQRHARERSLRPAEPLLVDRWGTLRPGHRGQVDDAGRFRLDRRLGDRLGRRRRLRAEGAAEPAAGREQDPEQGAGPCADLAPGSIVSGHGAGS